ncbi:MAG: DUF2071 domain-containing protein [Pedobacter sp.]|nr:DUF2071 domain-containing protein [Pedobacter sp.]MDQ8051836.1 DUF2071 domain-containing protein [Pedobacter sp.]
MIGNDIFLTAEWRKLILVNYAVDPSVLTKYLPPFTILDTWQGKCYLSLVGFMFVNTKLRDYGIPFHGNFEEVNLRFYVKYNDLGEWKRGVVFIKEIVPKPAITFIANTIYGENYQTLRMKHVWDLASDKIKISYSWKNRGWQEISVVADGHSMPILEGSEEEFITEHYWGYTKLKPHLTSEYGVQHPRWETYAIASYQVNVDFEATYGHDFNFLNNSSPDSVMLAEGSPIKVMKGRKIDG